MNITLMDYNSVIVFWFLLLAFTFVVWRLLLDINNNDGLCMKFAMIIVTSIVTGITVLVGISIIIKVIQ